MQTANDIAYLAGYDDGAKNVWQVTVKLQLAYAIISCLLIVLIWREGNRTWKLSHS